MCQSMSPGFRGHVEVVNRPRAASNGAAGGFPRPFIKRESGLMLFSCAPLGEGGFPCRLLFAASVLVVSRWF